MRSEFNGTGREKLAIRGAWLAVAAAVLALLLPSGASLAAEKPAKTLYERMGGYDQLSAIVDDFLGRLRDDEAFKRFGGGRSKDSLDRTTQLIKDQFCSLAGGPCVYIGRDMKTSHAGLEITDAEWESMMQKLHATLDKFQIGETEKKEFVALIENTRKDIVEKPAAGQPAEEKPKAQN